MRLVREHDKMAIAAHLLRSLRSDEKCIVFCGQKWTAKYVSSRLRESGVPTETIHGDRTQQERERVGARRHRRGISWARRAGCLRRAQPRLPKNIEVCVHRVRQINRAGRTGRAYTMMTLENMSGARKLVKILKKVGHKVPQCLMSCA
ncbi:putative ATP-dependent RNA helicase DDX43-like [Tropilaelaps mercedesae]|uniref:Putative ATP-dependent RNA helicase DDX43-like n=1 Tax=Tropilaelaps mercedesae TaxID=418985 RepID=A0A1V9X3V8_9ACAR|nr:putative ATP-dependent RNA helicase DDX43-like [Tropilaelaps mercedesae]